MRLTRPGHGHDILGAGVDRSCQCPYTFLPAIMPFEKLNQQAATKMMISQRVKGRIVFVASFLGYTSFAGYSNYSPGKYAIRGAPAACCSTTLRHATQDSSAGANVNTGLADSLRSELLQHSISVHLYMPAGIDSPGYVEEQRRKPRITKKIEEDDVVLSPESVAKSLLAGTSGWFFCFFLLVHPIRGETPGPPVS